MARRVRQPFDREPGRNRKRGPECLWTPTCRKNPEARIGLFSDAGRTLRRFTGPRFDLDQPAEWSSLRTASDSLFSETPNAGIRLLFTGTQGLTFAERASGHQIDQMHALADRTEDRLVDVRAARRIVAPMLNELAGGLATEDGWFHGALGPQNRHGRQLGPSLQDIYVDDVI